MKKLIAVVCAVIAAVCFAEYEYRTNSVDRVVYVYSVNTNGLNQLVQVISLPVPKNTNTIVRIVK